jgi:protein TonB
VNPEGSTQAAGRAAGLGVVIVLHLLVVWVLVNNLARLGVPAAQPQLIEIKLMKPEPPPAPPAPKVALLPLASLAPPPPPFIPPPEVELTPPETTVPATAIPQPAAGVGTGTAEPHQGPGREGGAPLRTPLQLDLSKCAPPAYPDIDAQGTVTIIFTMATTGAISEAHVAQSSGPSRRHKVLDRLAVEFVLSCKGIPGTVNGKAVPLRGITPVQWNLKD